MKIKNLYDKHPCVGGNGILGCLYDNTDDIVILTANADNNFLYYGIAENSLLFVKPTKKIKKDSLMVYEVNGKPKYKLSLSPIKDGEMIGRVIMCINQYE